MHSHKAFINSFQRQLIYPQRNLTAPILNSREQASLPVLSKIFEDRVEQYKHPVQVLEKVHQRLNDDHRR